MKEKKGYGILNKARDLDLPLILLTHMEGCADEAQPSDTPELR